MWPCRPWSRANGERSFSQARGRKRNSPTDSSCLSPIASSQIIDMSTSKTGKHGHAKVHLVATDVSTLTLAASSRDGAKFG